jgi:hypothetical protein
LILFKIQKTAVERKDMLKKTPICDEYNLKPKK